LAITKYKIITVLISLIWIVNGLYCKILNLVPRHRQIVSEILGSEHAGLLTKLIGAAEVLMAIWIFSGYKSRINALTQIIVVLTMNLIEFISVPELLLWGKLNLLFAILLAFIIYFNEFYLNKKLTP
jgi:uncharacterized membrane protein YphA (DoxX/SURF4 family)